MNKSALDALLLPIPEIADEMDIANRLIELRVPALAELEALREFAKRYGSHLPNCPNPYKRECECGFNQDRAAFVLGYLTGRNVS